MVTPYIGPYLNTAKYTTPGASIRYSHRYRSSRARRSPRRRRVPGARRSSATSGSAGAAGPTGAAEAGDSGVGRVIRLLPAGLRVQVVHLGDHLVAALAVPVRDLLLEPRLVQLAGEVLDLGVAHDQVQLRALLHVGRGDEGRGRVVHGALQVPGVKPGALVEDRLLRVAGGHRLVEVAAERADLAERPQVVLQRHDVRVGARHRLG